MSQLLRVLSFLVGLGNPDLALDLFILGGPYRRVVNIMGMELGRLIIKLRPARHDDSSSWQNPASLGPALVNAWSGWLSETQFLDIFGNLRSALWLSTM